MLVPSRRMVSMLNCGLRTFRIRVDDWLCFFLGETYDFSNSCDSEEIIVFDGRDEQSDAGDDFSAVGNEQDSSLPISAAWNDNR